MDRKHVHLFKQIGGTWIRRKKRENIAIFIDVQEARRNGLKFFSAHNEVIMCSRNESGYIPIKYFKEIKNIQTGEQIKIESNTAVGKINLDKRLIPLVQNYIPNRPTAVASLTVNDYHKPQSPMTSVKYNKNNCTRTGTTPMTIHHNTHKRPAMTLTTVNNSDDRMTKMTPTTQYCGEHYDEQAWKNIRAEQEKYVEIITVENINKATTNIPHNIPDIPYIPEAIIPTTTPPNPQEPNTTNKLQ